jgi:hypothetical protein
LIELDSYFIVSGFGVGWYTRDCEGCRLIEATRTVALRTKRKHATLTDHACDGAEGWNVVDAAHREALVPADSVAYAGRVVHGVECYKPGVFFQLITPGLF